MSSSYSPGRLKHWALLSEWPLSERSRCTGPQPCVKRRLLSTSAVFITLWCRRNSSNYSLSNWNYVEPKGLIKMIHGKAWSSAWNPHSSKNSKNKTSGLFKSLGSWSRGGENSSSCRSGHTYKHNRQKTVFLAGVLGQSSSEWDRR